MQTTLVVGVLIAANFVVQISQITQHTKTVRKARGHINLPRTRIVQFYAEPLTEGW